MKLLCCSKIMVILLSLTTTLLANIQQKSAIVYYGTHISYSLVGIHDYIIVQPTHTDVNRHGFNIYRDKMYAYISIGEVDKNIAEYKYVKKEWIVGNNPAWSSVVLDLTNPQYKKFLFEKMIEPQMKRGFKNFFFDTLDSYQIGAKTKEQKAKSKLALIDIIKTFHKRYPDAKLVINRGFELLDQIHNDITAVLFESYYYGLSGKDLEYKEVSSEGRKWLDIQIDKIAKYHLDCICVDYLPLHTLTSKKAKKVVQKLQRRGLIPYIATKDLTTYGKSSKNPLKREILTLIDETLHDRVFLAAHQYGALPLEYQGYIQKLYDLHKHPLPTMKQMQEYRGVVIWLNGIYKNPKKMLQWLRQLQKFHIKFAIVGHLPLPLNKSLKKLSLKVNKKALTFRTSSQIFVKDSMIGYELQPSLTQKNSFIDIKKGRALLTLHSVNGVNTTYAAIMPWGGFAVGNGFMKEFKDDNIWIINPFKFFKEALRLPTIPAPDVTTEYGKRIFVSHIDGDGSMNRVEWNPKLFAIDIIYDKVLKKYPLPMSASIVGAEDDNNGLYPKLAPRLQKTIKKMYRLPYVEPATHTFSHPFFWEKIHNDRLAPNYRLAPKGYKFSLKYETEGMLHELNTKYMPKGKYPKAKTLFWSGDCTPPANILAYLYKHHILNYNGGDTYITNLHPWLSYIAPLGLERGGYYQIYTGQQDENVYTNNWHGPFWGFKKVIQTFKLTNKPRRLKIMDLYYHYYSGSKRAALNALDSIYKWVLKQDINPMFTSSYIPKVMDFYTLSLAKVDGGYLVAGIRNLKTLRFDRKNLFVDMSASYNVLGFKKEKNGLYIHLGKKEEAYIHFSTSPKSKRPYLISTNATIHKSDQRENGFTMQLQSFLPIKLALYLPQQCHYHFSKTPSSLLKENNIFHFSYQSTKRVTLNVLCKYQ